MPRACLPRLQPFTERCLGRSSSTVPHGTLLYMASVRVFAEGMHFIAFHYNIHNFSNSQGSTMQEHLKQQMIPLGYALWYRQKLC